jgi:hypothetical protein
MKSRHDRGQGIAAPSTASVSWRPPAGITVLATLILGMAAIAVGEDPSIASKRSQGFYVSLTSHGGRLAAGKNEYCLSFKTVRDGKPANVENVHVEFAQEVGRILEKAIKSTVAQQDAGRYCGAVDLGQRYYQPAFYYVTVHYTYGFRKTRRCRFLITLK